MAVIRYAAAVVRFQHVIEPLFSAVEAGLEDARHYFASKGYPTENDRHTFAALVRLTAMQRLLTDGLEATAEDSDHPAEPMSALLIKQRSLVVRVLKATRAGGSPPHEVPVPHTERRRAFYRQHPLPGLEDIAVDNLLVLWSATGDVLDPEMTMVHTLDAGTGRDSLRYNWHGPLRRDMIGKTVADLEGLATEYPMLGEGDTG